MSLFDVGPKKVSKYKTRTRLKLLNTHTQKLFKESYTFLVLSIKKTINICHLIKKV